jgi:hypothetical protein
MATRPSPGSEEHGRCEQQPPDTAPEPTSAAPGLDLVADGVEADRVLLSVVALADQRHILHVDAGPGKRADRVLDPILRVEDVDQRSLLVHGASLRTARSEVCGKLIIQSARAAVCALGNALLFATTNFGSLAPGNGCFRRKQPFAFGGGEWQVRVAAIED